MKTLRQNGMMVSLCIRDGHGIDAEPYTPALSRKQEVLLSLPGPGYDLEISFEPEVAQDVAEMLIDVVSEIKAPTSQTARAGA